MSYFDNESPSAKVLSTKELIFAILDFCEDDTRNTCIFLSRVFHDILTSDEAFKWHCERLHVERGLYHPLLPGAYQSWKSIFLVNWERRFLWETTSSGDDNDTELPSTENFHIQVFARFKPKKAIPGWSDENRHHQRGGKRVTLPLHQRLAIIKMNRKLATNREAFEVLKEQGDWFGASHKDPECETTTPKLSGGVQYLDCQQNAAFLVDRVKGLRKFQFDKVMDPNCKQEAVYLSSAQPLVTEFLNGFNATCMVYGQTGSGKTHTMYGPVGYETIPAAPGEKIPDSWGVVPRACHEIFQAVEFRQKNLDLNLEATVAVSYIEIFGNVISDLLRGGIPCGHSRVSAQRYVLDGSSEVPAKSMSQVLELLTKGEQQKRKAATAMNARSSRAHALFIVTLRQKCLTSGVTSENRLCLADLGGSEQTKKSQPFGDNQNHRERMREAVNINLGLLALKQCVEALQRNRFVPYADSRLTMMLSPSLGGDSKTSIIVCGAQEENHVAETIAAMKFGQICRGISNEVRNNANMLQGLLQKLDDMIATCEANIRAIERWEVQRHHRHDGQGNLLDIRTTTRVVGAEALRRELATLLQQKMELTGDVIMDLDQKPKSDFVKNHGFGNSQSYGFY